MAALNLSASSESLNLRIQRKNKPNISSSFIVHKNFNKNVQSDDDEENTFEIIQIKPLMGDNFSDSDRQSAKLSKENSLNFKNSNQKGLTMKLKESKLPLHPSSKGNATTPIKEGQSTFPSLLARRSQQNQYITPERKLKGIYMYSPQERTVNAQPKQQIQLTNVNSAKFFKARKQSHSKLRAGETESLYEESMKIKIQINNLKEDNLKLKTQIQTTEKELEKRDQVIEEVMSSLNKNLKCSECSLKDPASPVRHKKLLAILKTSLTNNLKRQVKDLRQEVSDLRKEKMEVKNTKVNEVTTELEIMKEE
jgi:hypothetical protein